jgi:hypothetical protein
MATDSQETYLQIVQTRNMKLHGSKPASTQLLFLDLEVTSNHLWKIITTRVLKKIN